MEGVSGEYEIIYVDDGSNDSSSEILRALGQKFPKIRVVSFQQNCGQSAAFYAGFKSAQGEWIITLDADGQNPPEEITPLLEFYEKFDFVTGVRKSRSDHWSKKVASRIARLFRRSLLGDTTKDVGCSLRIFRREVVDALPFFRNFHRFFVFLVRTRGFSVKEVSVAHHQRAVGKSKYGNWKRLQEGVFDLWGVWWLKKRMIKYEIKHER
jgi:glycosyltransferase involved in cell wall biosynthesis